MYTETFELPVGYEDKEGGIHKACVMRRVTNQDLISVAKDPAMRELSKSTHKLGLSSLQIKKPEPGKPPQIEGDFDPIASVMTQAATAEMNSILFSYVVLSVGTIERPPREVFQRMHPRDMAVIDERFTKMNYSDLEIKAEGKKPVPLEPSEN